MDTRGATGNIGSLLKQKKGGSNTYASSMFRGKICYLVASFDNKIAFSSYTVFHQHPVVFHIYLICHNHGLAITNDIKGMLDREGEFINGKLNQIV